MHAFFSILVFVVYALVEQYFYAYFQYLLALGEMAVTFKHH